MRGTFVNFPDEGRVWVDFKYEGLPKYCLICGLLGHATRVCKGSQELGMIEGETSEELGERFAFKGLDAFTDLRGKLLGAGGSTRTPRGSRKGRKDTGRWKDDRNEEQDGGKRSGRSSTASGMGSHSQLGASRSFSGSDYTDTILAEEVDTAISPNKPRWSTSRLNKERLNLADKIRHQRGVIAEGAENVILHEILKQEIYGNLTGVSTATGQRFDLNSAPFIMEGIGDGILDNGVEVGRLMSVDGAAENGISTEDDPFQLGPIIQAITMEQKGRKRNIQEMTLSSTTTTEEPLATRPRKGVSRVT
ncbi:hypothetical protein ACFX13_006229 [Malus domestica]